MKFKVGQKVRAKGDRWFNKGELVTIVELDALDEMYLCKGASGVRWQDDSTLESPPQTLEDKLELFKAGTHVLHTPTQEIYDKLMVEFEKRGYKWHNWVDPKVSRGYWSDYNNETIVCCGVFDDNEGVTYDKLGGYSNAKREVLELTLEDFRMGNAHRVSDSEQEEHMKITIETDGHHKTTAECNGITAESLCNPMDEFKLSKGVHMAVQRLLEKLEEDTGFHMGDIVEVVNADGYKFFDKVKGIQGIIVSHYNEGVCEVKFPFVVSTKDTWYYHTRALKLIRRGNN